MNLVMADELFEDEDLLEMMNANLIPLPGRQMVPFLTIGAGSSIMQGQTETSLNYGIGTNFFVQQKLACRFEFRNYSFDSGSSNARRDNTNFEFSVGVSFYL